MTLRHELYFKLQRTFTLSICILQVFEQPFVHAALGKSHKIQRLPEAVGPLYWYCVQIFVIVWAYELELSKEIHETGVSDTQESEQKSRSTERHCALTIAGFDSSTMSRDSTFVLSHSVENT